MEDRIQIGWFASWLGLRIVTVTVLYAGARAFYAAIYSPHPDPHKHFLFAFWATAAIILYPLATGYADRAGIHFRRYLILRFAPWDDVERVLWSAQAILVFFHGPRASAGPLHFKRHAGPMDALTEASGEFVREPEFIRWLGSVSLEQTKQFEVRHWERRDSLWRNPSLYRGQLVALACVWAVAGVLYIFSAMKPH